MKKVPVIILWAIAFAYVEAAVVEYLRALYYPPGTGGFAFPILTLDELGAMGTEHLNRLTIEVGREIATLAMLALAAVAASRNRREGWAYFMIAFGAWDIAYYIWLKIFLDWPAGLMTWDLLFLVPVPWVSPAAAPLIVSVTLIVSGLMVLAREDRGRPLSPTRTHWAFLTAGGLIVIVSFCWDYRNIMNGGVPNPFNWTLFFIGLAVGITTFATILLRAPAGNVPEPSDRQVGHIPGRW
ncbi:MAG: hypothetical protein RDU20_11705 [Desulfomonilaceae bacterium]|nr:hypothetical protein [Desulfomonilaceae bacterium]